MRESYGGGGAKSFVRRKWRIFALVMKISPDKVSSDEVVALSFLRYIQYRYDKVQRSYEYLRRKNSRIYLFESKSTKSDNKHVKITYCSPTASNIPPNVNNQMWDALETSRMFERIPVNVLYSDSLTNFVVFYFEWLIYDSDTSGFRNRGYLRACTQ